MTTERIVISKSSMKKMTNSKVKPANIKANAMTVQVVYKTKHSNGRYTSVTKHEIA